MRFAPIGTRNEYLEIIEICTNTNNLEMLPILVPAAQGKINFLVVERNHFVPADILQLPGSVVITIGDGIKCVGPCGWPQARVLTGWSDAILLQCTRGFRNDYGWVAGKAVAGKRTMIIEAGLQHLPVWTDFVIRHKSRKCELLTALPIDGSATRRLSPSLAVKPRAE